MPTPFAPTQATAAWPCPKPMQRAIACAKPRPAPPATIATASCSIGPGSRSPPVISTDALSVAQLVEQAGARHVDRLEHPAVALGGGPEQAALHPAFDVQRRQAAMRAQELVECGHVNCSMGLRGS